MLECPQFDDVRAQFADQLQDARDGRNESLSLPLLKV